MKQSLEVNNLKLTGYLKLASCGDKESIKSFLAELIVSKIFTPSLKKNEQGDFETPLTQNQKKCNTLSFYQFRSEGQVFVPIYLSLESYKLSLSSNDLYEPSLISFKELLLNLDANSSLWLEPDSEVGKEFSPWEIELLRAGEGSIPEIVENIVSEDASFDSKLDSDLDYEDDVDFSPLLVNLKRYFSSSDLVKEAFLVCSRNSAERILALKVLEKDKSPAEFELCEIEKLLSSFKERRVKLKVFEEGDSSLKTLINGVNPFYLKVEKIKSTNFKQLFHNAILRSIGFSKRRP